MHLLQGYELHAEKEQKQKYLKGKKNRRMLSKDRSTKGSVLPV